VNIVITGASGFVGFNLARYLAERGHGLTLIDLDDYCQRISMGSNSSTMHLISHNLISGGLKWPEDTDCIIHLAAMPHVDYSYHRPVEVFQNNTASTQSVLQHAADHRIPVILASSVEVYGGQHGKVYRESDEYAPVSPYSASKVACEMLAQSYAQCYGLSVKVFRLTNLYGPWQLPDRVVPRNMARMIAGLPLDIQGSAVRDFLYIEDALRAIELILYHGRERHIYNISSGVGTTIQEIGRELQNLKPSERVNLSEEEPTNSRGSSLVIDSGKLRAELGWEPQTMLEEGLERTFVWYETHKDWVRQFAKQYGCSRENRDFLVDMARYGVVAV